MINFKLPQITVFDEDRQLYSLDTLKNNNKNLNGMNDCHMPFRQINFVCKIALACCKHVKFFVATIKHNFAVST